MTNSRNTQIPQASAWVSSITAANAPAGPPCRHGKVLMPLFRTPK